MLVLKKRLFWCDMFLGIYISSSTTDLNRKFCLIFTQKWHQDKRNVKVGDICMLTCQNSLRDEWRMSLVSETIPDNHDKVRDVKLKVPSSSLDGTQDYRPPAMSEVDRHVKNVPVEEEGTFILHLILLLKRVNLEWPCQESKVRVFLIFYFGEDMLWNWLIILQRLPMSVRFIAFFVKPLIGIACLKNHPSRVQLIGL